MEGMLRRSLFRVFVFVAGLGLVACSLAAHGQDDSNKRGRKYKAPPPTARIEVTILKDVNGKPVENAAVIFHPMEGEKDKGNMEQKTNEDGKTIIDVLPLGDTVRLQVIAHGFQTYGEDYKIQKPEMTIEIRMKRPGEQYSIYKSHDAGEVGGKGADPAPAKDAAPSKPADSTPPPSQPQTN
jgi:5-hydroxyisourate hydrolase-like protein (transthyretin family)